MILIISKDHISKLSDNLSSTEMMCKCNYPECRAILVSSKLIEQFELLRKRCGNIPLKITSGHRCPRHNWQENGVALSQHQVGCALDILCPNHLSIDEFAKIAEGCFPFVKKYNNRLHVDTRGE